MATKQDIYSQRAWARVAGLMYWLVLVLDMTAMQSHSPAISQPLGLAGALFVIPLSLGLYFALRPGQNVLAATALGCRLVEATLGILSALAGFATVQAALAQSSLGSNLRDLARWDHSSHFDAFIFTIGSTIFFYLFVKSHYIPSVLAWLGLCASLLAFSVCLAHLLRPAFPVMTMYAWLPMLLAELSTGLWLVIKSVRVPNEEWLPSQVG